MLARHYLPQQHDEAGNDQRPPQVAALSARRHGATISVTAVPADAEARHYYWLIDGQYVTHTAARTLDVVTDQAATIEVIASRHRDWDGRAWQRIPRGRRHTLQWVRSAEAVDYYRVEFATGLEGGTWTEFARVSDDGAWSWAVTTPDLDDLTWYRFRVVPVRAGNDGTPGDWAPRFICRRPAAPASWGVTYAAGLLTVQE
jgi:hypothetical protein